MQSGSNQESKYKYNYHTCVTLVTLTKYFRNRQSRSNSWKYGRKNMSNSAQVSLTKRLINSSNGD